MNRKRRTEILINGSAELASRLAQNILDHYDVQTLEEPNEGLVMIKMRENAKKHLFYLGELYVTESKVLLNQKIGLGTVKGHQPELAYWLAVIDAAYNAELPETEEWASLLTDEEQRIREQQRNLHSRVLRTKVNFETMDDDD